MRPTTAFAAPFGFVGWTISSPLVAQGGLPYSLYTFLGANQRRKAWLGITVSCELGFPEFGRCHLAITPQAAPRSESYSGGA